MSVMPIKLLVLFHKNSMQKISCNAMFSLWKTNADSFPKYFMCKHCRLKKYYWENFIWQKVQTIIPKGMAGY
ncbi:hypothetical protein BDA96_02G154000 [Sorghum bicolor]|uniref:Uncharacterized protein n=2 Tax=Sorghum bicolor TaxID=4558 RepID=A0A921USQ2_SORBI|nr:hypothetical protein BDA96_02G154000 [Sorghum bicolor]OQU89110.1 hypothetical protein SORBI_3002G147550 [Sorghum bicolor]